MLGERLNPFSNMLLDQHLFPGETRQRPRIFQMETDFVTALFKKFHDVIRRKRATAKKNVSPRPFFIQQAQHFFQFLEVSQGLNPGTIEIRTQSAENMPMDRSFPIRSINIKTNNQGHRSSKTDEISLAVFTAKLAQI
jgi:hypothetical protein